MTNQHHNKSSKKDGPAITVLTRDTYALLGVLRKILHVDQLILEKVSSINDTLDIFANQKGEELNHK